MQNDCKNANLHFQMTFSLTSTSCLLNLPILGRERLRVRDFAHRTTLSACKPASFCRERRDKVVILVRGFAKMLSCPNKSRPLEQFWHFSIREKAHLHAIRITEQPMLLTKRKINGPG